MTQSIEFDAEQYQLRGNPLFGPWPDVPRARDAWFLDVPEEGFGMCLYCGVAIEDDDFGEVQPVMRDGRAYAAPVHGECTLMPIVGHEFGICGCTDWGGTGDRREGALLLWQRIQER